MIRLLALAALAAALFACSPAAADPGLVETAVAATMAAQVTPTPPPTDTPAPTPTPAPTDTPEPTPTLSPEGIACLPRNLDYTKQFINLSNRWLDALVIAGQSPNMTLGLALTDMRNIRDEFVVVVPPACAVPAHNAMRLEMDLYIKATEAIVLNPSDPAIPGLLLQAELATQAATEEITKLKNEPSPGLVPRATATP